MEKKQKLGTVLVVDDTAENIDILKCILSDEFIVKVATTGEKALSIAETTLPDLILLDVMMPGIDGFEVCSRLKQMEATKEIPVIFVTALTEEISEERGFEVGCVDYITKPISPPMALARVKTHMALRNARKELLEWNSNLKGRVKGLSSLVSEKVQKLGSNDMVKRQHREEWLNLTSHLLDMIEIDLPGHAGRVAAMAVEAARRVNCSPAEIETIRIAALLHDIGKIGLSPEVILPEPDKLPEPLKQIYQTHSVRGQFLLSGVDGLDEVGVLIRHHHEKMNGSGTPDHLIEAEIPLGSRIIALADHIDRSVNHARYGTQLYTVLKNTRNLAGRSFDKALIPCFEEVAPFILEQPEFEKRQREIIPLDELATGMVAGEKLYTGSHILLFECGEKITAEKFLQMCRSREIDPPACSKVLVYTS